MHCYGLQRVVCLLLASLFVAGAAHAAVCGVDLAPAPCAQASDARAACLAAVNEAPGDEAARLSLCETMMAAGEFDAAAVVVRDGLVRCADSTTCRDRFRLADSIVNEARVGRDRADPLAAERTLKAARRRCQGPLSDDRSVAACEQLLLDAPQDTALYEALLAKLLKRDEPVSALGYVLDARAATGREDALGAAFETALAQRAPRVEECLQGSSVALCESVYVVGLDDEADVLLQTATLLTQAGERDEARALLQRAKGLRPQDGSIDAALARLRPPRRQPPSRPAPPAETAVDETAPAAAVAAAPDVGAAPAPAEERPARNGIDGDGRVH